MRKQQEEKGEQGWSLVLSNADSNKDKNFHKLSHNRKAKNKNKTAMDTNQIQYFFDRSTQLFFSTLLLMLISFSFSSF